MKETLLVRLKPQDPRRGHVLRRYTYRGIKFQDERGWYRVEREVAEYLREVRQVASDEHSPLAFDVCTMEEAQAIDAREKAERSRRRSAVENIKLSAARTDTASTEDVPAGRDNGSDHGNDGDKESGEEAARRPRKK